VLADVAMRALSRVPEDRFASAEDLGVAIEAAAAETWGREWSSATPSPLFLTKRVRDAGSQFSAVETATPSPAVRSTIAHHVQLRPIDVARPSQLVAVRRRHARVPPATLLLVGGLLVVVACALTLSDARSPRLARDDISEVHVNGQVVDGGQPI